MNKIDIYLAHALTGAPAVFVSEMDVLRSWIEREIPEVNVLRFNWVIGKGPDTKAIPNTYTHDIDRVCKARLVVAVLNYPSVGLGMEIQERCRLGLPMRCFIAREVRLSQIIPDCIKYFRGITENVPDIPDPIVYGRLAEIVTAIKVWIAAQPKHRDLFEAHPV